MFGETRQNPYIEPNETIYVPTIKSVVSISGNIKRPGTYEILPGETYKDLLKMAGGYSAQADISQIKLSRILPHHQEVNLSVTPNLPLQRSLILKLRWLGFEFHLIHQSLLFLSEIS